MKSTPVHLQAEDLASVVIESSTLMTFAANAQKRASGNVAFPKNTVYLSRPEPLQRVCLPKTLVQEAGLSELSKIQHICISSRNYIFFISSMWLEAYQAFVFGQTSVVFPFLNCIQQNCSSSHALSSIKTHGISLHEKSAALHDSVLRSITVQSSFSCRADI